jgi:hypothetical protein
LTPEILRDVCRRITGRTDYTVDFDNVDYNKGRLAKLEYGPSSFYISFSEFEIKSRNSFFQSFPSALIKYHQDPNPNKEIFFYFLTPDGNIETSYFRFMYRLMKTAGTIFLNEDDHLGDLPVAFNSASDIIAQRDLNRGRNSANASTYITTDENGILQIYGKTYGANKYETALISLAIREIAPLPIELYEIEEGNLKVLPEAAREVIESKGITVITSDLVLERQEFDRNDSLRSPTYMFNLLEKLGEKKCTMCNCEIPQIIQGAHIWPVASIKSAHNINQDEKLEFAINGDNGIWLCNNHHKLFDIHALVITEEGRIKYRTDIREVDEDYLYGVTVNDRIADAIINDNFLQFLEKRNTSLDLGEYSYFEDL